MKSNFFILFLIISIWFTNFNQIVFACNPVAVCQSGITLSVDFSPITIDPSAIDVGSFDQCGDPITLEIRSQNSCQGSASWGQFVTFDCCDVGLAVFIELRVTDNLGNSAICMSEVFIGDFIPPIINCASDKTVNCNDPNINDLNQLFDEPFVDDNCFFTVLSSTDSGVLDNCNVGTLSREWQVYDNFGNSNICTQNVMVEHISDFIVQFPNDVTVGSCPYDPTITGEVILSNVDCEMISISYQDDFSTSGAACLEIYRLWTVTNGCIYDPSAANTNLGNALPIPNTYQDDGDGYFSFTQLITVNGSQSPILNCQSNLTFCTSPETCEANITGLILTTQQNCYTNIAYQIDLYGDGSIDIINTGDNASGTYPLGSHQIEWYVQDDCGNLTTCQQTIIVLDCQPPTPICVTGLDFDLTTSTPGVDMVWASDLFDSVYDNCQNTLIALGIRPSGASYPPSDSYFFDCTSIGILVMELWVYDDAGNSSYCVTSITINDPNDVCAPPCQNILPLSGTIYSNTYRAIQNINAMNGMVPNTENVIFVAGESIDLLPEFEVQLGAEFLALPDTDPCNY